MLHTFNKAKVREKEKHRLRERKRDKSKSLCNLINFKQSKAIKNVKHSKRRNMLRRFSSACLLIPYKKIFHSLIKDRRSDNPFHSIKISAVSFKGRKEFFQFTFIEWKISSSSISSFVHIYTSVDNTSKLQIESMSPQACSEFGKSQREPSTIILAFTQYFLFI